VVGAEWRYILVASQKGCFGGCPNVLVFGSRGCSFCLLLAEEVSSKSELNYEVSKGDWAHCMGNISLIIELPPGASVVMVVSLATFGEACKVLCAEDWRYDPALGIKVRRDLPFSVSMLVLTSVYDTPVNLWHDWRKMMMSITVMS
jgi:hypothetical protein